MVQVSKVNCLQVRGAVLAAGGVEVLVDLIYKWIAEPAALCNACLCLMSLVRGEGPQSEVTLYRLRLALPTLAALAAAKRKPRQSG